MPSAPNARLWRDMLGDARKLPRTVVDVDAGLADILNAPIITSFSESVHDDDLRYFIDAMIAAQRVKKPLKAWLRARGYVGYRNHENSIRCSPFVQTMRFGVLSGDK